MPIDAIVARTLAIGIPLTKSPVLQRNLRWSVGLYVVLGP